jgi:hypothetical protein
MEEIGRRFSMLNASRREIAAMTEGWWRHRAAEASQLGLRRSAYARRRPRDVMLEF